MSCPLFDLYAAERSSAGGRRGEFWILAAPDWVNVVPVIRAPSGGESFVMVRQFRHGSGTITTEFPAGLVEPGEDPLHAAGRELSEETGYRAGMLRPLGRVQPNPAFMGNWCHTFLAEDLAHPGAQSLDERELVDTVVVPSREVDALMGTGEYVNSLTLVALHFYRRLGAGGA